MGEGFFAQGLVFEAYCPVFGLGRVRIPDGVISGMVGIWLIVLFSLSRDHVWVRSSSMGTVRTNGSSVIYTVSH